ncbi:CPBP family intramembrane glutamic endopeptidase [Litorihabitans aurantiacus]|uniref:CAAX prenyl protease 2/Lysostaphin resistance protein A-like domain-containing protein n=1 Tax=Litorihabitans aurantiacus TaxID=1930061 RepID=A0AA37UV28_9MICO|nr:CPBP family intramembrane glutamic endopeptidase [Litorihabitans aurantiacus]GMA30936.1 hypothetical protein GCM10025875_09280 [Litorihabitans aurantiacus]
MATTTQGGTNGATGATQESPGPWYTRVNDPTFRFAPRDVVALLAGLAVVLLVYEARVNDIFPGLDLSLGLTGPASTTLLKWVGAALLLAVVLVLERRRLATMLLVRPTGKDVSFAVYAFGVAIVWSWLASMIWPQGANEGQDSITGLGVGGVLILLITAAVTEEIVYRGYLAERFGALLRSRWIGAAVSLAIFVVPHVVVFGPSWLLIHLVGSLAIVTVVLVRCNLWAAMLTHLLVNAPILIPTILG